MCHIFKATLTFRRKSPQYFPDLRFKFVLFLSDLHWTHFFHERIFRIPNCIRDWPKFITYFICKMWRFLQINVVNTYWDAWQISKTNFNSLSNRIGFARRRNICFKINLSVTYLFIYKTLLWTRAYWLTITQTSWNFGSLYSHLTVVQTGTLARNMQIEFVLINLTGFLPFGLWCCSTYLELPYPNNRHFILLPIPVCSVNLQ